MLHSRLKRKQKRKFLVRKEEGKGGEEKLGREGGGREKWKC